MNKIHSGTTQIFNWGWMEEFHNSILKSPELLRSKSVKISKSGFLNIGIRTDVNPGSVIYDHLLKF